MYLHFEDWTSPVLLKQLDDKDMPHGGRIIKVFAGETDVRTIASPALTVVEFSGLPFADDEVFDYHARGIFDGATLEKDLATKRLCDAGKQTLRSLFRFSNCYGFCQASMFMLAQRGGGWLIGHPFADIDGVDKVEKGQYPYTNLHLDIFSPATLSKLKEIVDYDDETKVLKDRDGFRLRPRKVPDPS